jgi:hypothetical protein
MQGKNIGMDLAIGCAAGLLATRVTDYVQKLLWELTPASERAKEPKTLEGSSAKSAARLFIEKNDLEPTEDNLVRGKVVIHYGLGLAWGPLYCLLRRGSGMTPAGAGATSGMALSLVVDETLSPLLGITPPNRMFPVSAHLRGFATHIAWGITAAVAAETLHRLLRHPLPSQEVKLRS